jgi:SecD/SecF fusion protein
MRNKSAIGVFTLLLVIACIYQLSFTFFTKGVENEALVEAKSQWDLVQSSGDTEVALGVDTVAVDGGKEDVMNYYEGKYISDHSGDEIYPFFGISYQKCKDQELGLGLDLQGGMSVTLEVSIPELLKNLAGNSPKASFKEPFKEAMTNYGKGVSADFVELFFLAYDNSQWKGETIRYFNVANQAYFPADMTNLEIKEKLNALSIEAIDKTQRIIEARINKFGVSQPNIQKQPLSGRLHIELAGAKDINRVRNLLQSTASLQFLNAYHKNLRGEFIKLNNSLKKSAVSNVVEDSLGDILDLPAAYEVLTDSVADLLTGNDKVVYDSLSKINSNNQLIEAQQFAEEKADSDSLDLVANTGPLFSKFTFTQQNIQPKLGHAKGLDTAAVSVMLNDPLMASLVPSNVSFLWTSEEESQGGDVMEYSLIAVQTDGDYAITGEDIKDAFQDYNQENKPSVTVQMKSYGAGVWKDWTTAKVGSAIAIILDNQVFSYPYINEAIPNGSTIISGNFTIEEAQDLANILKAGSLPAPALIVDEAIVGPSLGAENISSGMWSFVIALIMVLLYMAFYYSKAGIVASIALIANIFFILGTLASMGAALTLPGIAGLVLTIGMSVDANVLIYERIREELRAGKGIKLAVADGYKHAYSAILDANITSLITAIVLAYFGSGPIQGFATILIIGVFTSLFSSIFVTRLIFTFMLDKKWNFSFSNKLTANLFTNTSVGFIKKRKFFYVISAMVIIGGVVSLVSRGLDGGVEFTGGRTYRVEFTEIPGQGQEDLRDAIASYSINEEGVEVPPLVKTVNNKTTSYEITTKYLYEDKSQNSTRRVDSVLALAFNQFEFAKGEIEGATGKTFEITNQRSVDAQISSELITSSVRAIIFSLIAIFLYIAFRFKRWQWGLGALLAMFHDVLVVLGLFSMLYGVVPFSMEIDQAFIAAILTVVGYSINDTVVVFDRIREYIGIHKRDDAKTVVNNALNSTLSRTLNTSLSTFLVLLIIFLFGGESIKGFSFALMIGVVVGTYSSLCIASPSVVDLTKSIMPVNTDKK